MTKSQNNCSSSAIFVSSKMKILAKSMGLGVGVGRSGGSVAYVLSLKTTAALQQAAKSLATHHHSFLSETHLFFLVLLLLIGCFCLSVGLSFPPYVFVCLCVCVHMCVYMCMFMHTCLRVCENAMTRSCCIYSHCFDLHQRPHSLMVYMLTLKGKQGLHILRIIL